MRLFLLIFSALACLQIAPLHAQTGASVITGRVLNGSAGSEPMAAVPVSLYVIEGQDRRLIDSSQSDADGIFRFDRLSPAPSSRYIVTASNDGVSYASSLITSGSPEMQSADVTTYLTTDDSTAISVDRLSIVPASVDSASGLITLVESYRVQNATNRTYIGKSITGERQSLLLSLFPGARNLTPLEGFGLDDAVANGDGFAISRPLLPGVSVISFSYELPYRSRAIDLRRQIEYRIGSVELVLPGNVQVSSPQLRENGTLHLGDRSFDTIQGSSLPAGSEIELKMDGLQVKPRQIIDVASLPVQLAMLCLLVAGLAGFVLISRERATTGPVRRPADRADAAH
jgi:hypothetical protein